MNWYANATLEKVTDLHDLRNPVINVVLYKLEESQTLLGFAKRESDQRAEERYQDEVNVLTMVIHQMHAAAVYQERHGWVPGAPQEE